MISKSRHLIAAALIAAFGATAMAQAPQAAPAAAAAPAEAQQRHHKHGGAHDSARMQQRMAKRLDALKQKLAITPAQESAWSTWTAALQPPATRPARPSRDEMAKLSTPERIDKMRELRGQHQALMDKRADATKTFYATLDAEQKKRFDDATARFMARRHGGGMGGHGGHHGKHHHG